MILQLPKPSEIKFREARSPRLHFIAYADSAIPLVLRGFTLSGLIHDRWTLAGTGTAEDHYTTITEVPLDLLLSTTTTGLEPGRCFLQVYLQFAGVDTTLLMTGYIATGQPIAYPAINLRTSTDDPGGRLTYTVADPAAGAEVHIPVPSRNVWLLHNVRFQFITAVAVANRLIHLLIRDSTDKLVAFSVASTTQVASLTRDYSFAPYTTIPAAWDINIAGHLPRILLTRSMYIDTVTDNIQAADQYGAISLEIQRWVQP